MRTMYRLIATLAALALLAGCATITGAPTQAELNAWATSKLDAQIERDRAQAARDSAVQAIASQGEHGAMAAAMVLMSDLRGGAQSAQVPPWAGRKGIMDYLVPILGLGVQLHGINANKAAVITQSNNARILGVAQSADQAATMQTAFGAIQGQTNTYTYTASGDGASTGGSAYWSQANPVTTTTDSHDQTATPHVVNPLVITTSP